jgi:hypothetical protein
VRALGTTDVATNSTTFVLMTDMSVTLTTGAGNSLVNFTTTINHSRDNRFSEIALFVDGVRQVTIRRFATHREEINPVTITHLVTGLTAGTHTFDIRWRTQNADTTVSQQAATWVAERTLAVVELRN